MTIQELIEAKRKSNFKTAVCTDIGPRITKRTVQEGVIYKQAPHQLWLMTTKRKANTK